MLNSIKYIEQLFQKRIKSYVDNKPFFFTKKDPASIVDVNSDFGKYIIKLQPKSEEFVIICLGLIPYIYPNLLEQLIKKALPGKGNFSELGGVRGKNFRGFLPTGETALFLLAGLELEKRIKVLHIFNGEHYFAKRKILYLDTSEKNDPPLAGQIILNADLVDQFISGRSLLPKFSMQFPAEKLETQMNWEDLVLAQETKEQLEELKAWLYHHEVLMENWKMSKVIKPGYRVLFHGPPGTGKTLTAKLLGKTFDLPVFRIDLSMVISKYIGETEKNLANLFERAENKNWILFFDEADALFGKRTNVRDAHDKYANQEVAYLLQRVESYNGLVILASNYKTNIDEAFTRRFQSIIYFPIPDVAARMQLWKKTIPEPLQLAEDIDLTNIARQFELSGSEIVNIIQYSSLQTLSNELKVLSKQELLKGIYREFKKNGASVV